MYKRQDQDITLKGGEHFDTYESLAEVPITLQSGDIIYLQDVADIQMAEDENSSISRARGRENVMISIDKNPVSYTHLFTRSPNSLR